MTERINLDTITATKPTRSSLMAMMAFYEEFYGSPSSPHQMGQELLSHMEKSYKQIYALFSAKSADRFVFTSSGAESISQVIFSVYKNVVRLTGKNQFITSCIEDAAPILAISKLEDEGCVLKMAKVKNCHVTVDSIADEISPRTALVSLSAASALTGVVQPIHEIAKLCQERGIIFHVDASSALGKVNFDLEDMGAHFVTFSGNAVHAPIGTGGLFCSHTLQNEKANGVALSPLISGEEEQLRLRGGTLNVPLLIALGQAALEAHENINLYCTEVARLRDKLESQIQAAYPEAVFFFHDQERLPHITCIAFPGIRNEALLYALSRKGVFASMGGGAFQQVELVLKATGIDPITAQCALTFSLSTDTTSNEIDRASQIIAEVAKKLRRLSQKMV